MTRSKIKLNLHQLSLPFGQSQARTLSYENRQRFFWMLAGVSLMSLVVYFYAINATAHNIAVRQNLESKVTDSETALSGLEFSYIGLKNGVSLEMAYQYGFKEVQDPLYVSRSQANTLTLNTVKR